MNDTTDAIVIIGFNSSTTGSLISIILFLLVVTIIKLGYFYGHRFTQYLPESSLLLFLGMAFGYILSITKTSSNLFTINSYTFMYLLLPPIVLESAFAMYHNDFMSNIVPVMIFAIIATLLNFIFLSLSLWILAKVGAIESSINEITILIFCALITSVDPVAVLAIFQEIHVDNNLYYLVFGESLLNDGVAVVLYNVLKQLAALDEWHGMHYFKSCVSFVAVAVGGGLVGLIFGITTCLFSRIAYKSPLSEPIIVFGMSMIAYLVADMVGWSVIISMIMFGLIQVAYNFHNITHKSLIVIKRLAEILSNLSESIIFLSLGVTLFDIDELRWSSSFTLWSLFLCIYIRFVFTFLLSAIINRYELAVRRIFLTEQYIIAYGGMRGGISYCLAVLLENRYGIDKQSIINATIIIIMFTVVFMGITIGPLVRLLEIKIADEDKLSLIDMINETVMMHLLASIEAIVDLRGRYSFYEFLFNVNSLFIRPMLQRKPANYDTRLLETYKAIDLRLYMGFMAGPETEIGRRFLRKLQPNLKRLKYEFFEISNIEAILDDLTSDRVRQDTDIYLSDTYHLNQDPMLSTLSSKLLAILYQKSLLKESSTNVHTAFEKNRFYTFRERGKKKSSSTTDEFVIF